MLTFFNKTIVKRTPPGQRQTVQHEGKESFEFAFIRSFTYDCDDDGAGLRRTEHYVHVYMRSDGLTASATADAEYPPRVVFSLLVKLLEDFEVACP